jgi:hypothetical protein
MTYFYLPASGQVYSDATLYQNTGFLPTTDPGVLAANGIYTVIPEPDPYDYQLYNSTATYTVVGDYAQQGWTATPRDLPTAKLAGEQEAKAHANTQEASLVVESQLSNEVLTAVSSQDPIDRPARFQTVLDAMSAVSDQLDSNLTAIDAATTVDEINNIVNKPTGILFTGRGSGIGPLDLNVSYYNAFNSVSLTPNGTELYVPGTATVIPYLIDIETGNGYFDSMGNCFAVGDYLLQIRETATSMVIAEFECPLNPAGEDVAF